jgi:hypothetical protein
MYRTSASRSGAPRRHGLAGLAADRGFFTRGYLRLSVMAAAFLVSIPFAARVQHILDALRRRARTPSQPRA